MGSIHLDKVIISSFHESFRNREILTGTIDIPSSSLGAFGSIGYTLELEFESDGAQTEVYYQREGGLYRYKAENSFVLNDFQGPGDGSIALRNEEVDNLIIEIGIVNFSAGAITIEAQVFNITVYVFDTPFTPV